MINHFTFNGTSTAQLGLIVSGVSIFGAGSRKVEKAGIPGRNGDLQIELGGFNNYTVRYTVSITKNFTTTAQQIREWLLESKGYCDLTDTYHPDEIRKACFNSDIEFTTSMLYKYGQASIQFDCLPERYLTTNTPITTTATADTTTDTTMSLSTVPTPINISLNGNTTQEGSSGKNLIPRPYHQADGTYQGVTWTTDNMGKITASGTTTAGTNFLLTDNSNFSLRAGTYTLSVTGTLIGLDLKIYNGSAILATIANGSVNGKITFTLSTAQNIRTYFNTGYSNVSVNFSVYVQLEQGSTATAYEPHISPTNPQVIHNVSGDNEVSVLSKNLLGLVNGTYSSNGLTATVLNNIVTVKGTPSVNTTVDIPLNTVISIVGERLTKSLNIVGTYTGLQTSIRGYVANTGVGLWSNNGANATEALNAEGYWLRIQVNYNTPIDCSFMPQIEKGTTSTTYEPYRSQSYPLYLPVENLLDSDLLLEASGWAETDGVYFGANNTLHNKWGTNTNGIYNTFTQGEKYTFTFEMKQADTTVNNALVVRFYYSDNTYDGLGCTNLSNDYMKFTLTTTSTTKTLTKLILSFGNITNIYLKNLQLEKGAKVNQYNPYGTPPIELNKIGTHQDYIYKNGGKWYVHKETASVDMGTLTYQTDNGGVYFYSSVSGKGRTNFDLLCTCYTVTTSTNTSGMTDYQVKGQTSGSYIFVKDSRYTSATDLKMALSGETLKYNLATPTNTEITDTTLINQLNNIEKAYSYNGTTNILQVSNDNGFMLEVVSLHGSTFNSNYKGEPIITVNATGLIYLNGEVMEVLSAPVTINCQTMQCYNGVVNMNNEVRVNDFPEIKIGANEVGSSMALTITPNNWRH